MTPEEKFVELDKAIIDARGKLIAALVDRSAKRPASVQRYFDAAKVRQDDGALEIDEDACVSEGSDPGAYVQAWIWVSNDEIKN